MLDTVYITCCLVIGIDVWLILAWLPVKMYIRYFDRWKEVKARICFSVALSRVW